MPTDACPPDETLAKFLLGRLANPNVELLEDHFLSCEECASRSGRLPSSDDFVEAIQCPSSVRIDDAAIHLRNSDIIASEITRAAIGNSTVPGSDEATSENQSDDAAAAAVFLRQIDPQGTSSGEPMLDAFRINRLIGKGGMGMVFQAWDENLEREVAIKVISPVLVEDTATRERFFHEARSIASIQSDHVVPIHHVGEHNGIPYIVMPLLRGESLARRLSADHPISVEDACRIASETSLGLEAIHEKGLVHRDIKPENLWIDGNGGVKILDFGLARNQQQETGLTRTGTMVGTPRYMSPEQAEGEPIDHRSDLFSLGAVIYRILADRPPFDGKSVTALLMSIVRDDPVTLSTLRDDLPPGFGELVHRLLDKSPSGRYESAAAVTQALRQIEQRQTIPVSNTNRIPGRIALMTVALGILLLIGALVIQINTASGLVYVSIDSSDHLIQVDTKQDSISVQDPADGKTIDITVDRANRQLRFNKGGFVRIDKEYTSTGPNGTLEIRFEPILLNSQREIAEQIYRLGGRVALAVNEFSAGPEIAKFDDLPDGSLQIARVMMSDNKSLRDADLKMLGQLPNLKMIHVKRCNVTGEFLRWCPQIKSVFLQQCNQLRPEFLKYLCDISKLHEVGFQFSSVGDEIVDVVRKCPRLSRVAFGTDITPEGLKMITHLDLPLTLDFVSTRNLTSEDFGLLKNMTELQRVVVNYPTTVNPSIISELAKVSQLKNLYVSGLGPAPNAVPFDFQCLGDLKQIEELKLEGLHFPDPNLDALKEMASLKRFLVSRHSLSDGQIESIRKMLPDCEVIAD